MEINLLSGEVLGSSLLALGGAAVWLRKQRVGLSKDNADVALAESNVAASTAITGVVELLRSEVQRLNNANAELSKQVVHFQTTNIAQVNELGLLKIQNTNLTLEIKELKEQLIELRDIISNMGDCRQCKHKPND